MEALGWRGAWGFYEAADYLRPGEDGAPALVKSHMAHHQGMALCALCNALTGNSLRRDFMALPRARALSLLLEERPATREPGRRPPARAAPAARGPGPAPRRRHGAWPETHLLTGGGATALCTADGAVHYAGSASTPPAFPATCAARTPAACICGTRTRRGGRVGGAGSRVGFEPGVMHSVTRLGRVEAAMAVGVSPEDGTLLRVVELRNAGELAARLALSDVVPVALAEPEDYRAHRRFKACSWRATRWATALLFRAGPAAAARAGPSWSTVASDGGSDLGDGL